MGEGGSRGVRECVGLGSGVVEEWERAGKGLYLVRKGV